MRDSNEKYAKLGQGGREGIASPTFIILGPLHILETAKTRKDAKLGQRESRMGHVT